ncbi:MAG: OB-fold nucleic acid binding domain-containing protein [Candidatus Bathyarchaeia archaeon]
MSEEIIKRILALKPQLTREAVERLIEEEKMKAAGLLTDDAAAHFVASNLGILGAGERIEAKLKIGGLTSGLNNVSLTGRVLHVFPAKKFTRVDGREGKLVKMLLGDSTGIVNVLLWDEKADQIIAGRIGAGKIIRILNGYTRERRGDIELNVGLRGEIYQEPFDGLGDAFPPLHSFFKTPKDIHGPGIVNLIGVVTEKYSSSTFTRGDGSEGRVARMALEEGGGKITIIVWNERVEELDVEVGARLKIIGGVSKMRRNGQLEVHVSPSTVVEVLEVGAAPSKPFTPLMKIADIKAGMGDVSVLAYVSRVGGVKEFSKSDGGRGKVSSAMLRDETGMIRLNLWDDEAENVKHLKEGDCVFVEHGYARISLGEVALNLGRNSTMTVNPEGVRLEKFDWGEKITDISKLREGETNVTIRGRIVDPPQVREVNTSRGLTRVASFKIDDGTGEARVSVWRGLVDEAEKLPLGAIISIDGCVVKPPFDGLIQISSGSFSRIRVERGEAG